jgi:NADH dehydrogenase FAD-containing subunit
VVVVGYGWGGKAFCDTINHRKYDITVISKTDYMLNTPKLKDSVFGPINSYKNLYIDRNKPNGQNHRQFKFIQDEVKDVRELRQKYDYVVLAPGSVPNDFGIPGVKENCYFFRPMNIKNGQ